jgi:hypothetical protein
MQQTNWKITSYIEEDIKEVLTPLLVKVLTTRLEKSEKKIHLVVAYFPAINNKNKYPVLKNEIDKYIHIYLYIIDPIRTGFLIEDFCFREKPKHVLTLSNTAKKVELYRELENISKKINLLNDLSIIDHPAEDPDTVTNLLKSDRGITLDEYLKDLIGEKTEHLLDTFINMENVDNRIYFINQMSKLIISNKQLYGRGSITEYHDLDKIKDKDLLSAILEYNAIVRIIRS